MYSLHGESVKPNRIFNYFVCINFKINFEIFLNECFLNFNSGVGIGMVIVSAWVGIYYNVVITYTLYYMFMSLTTSLPWAGCDHEWNTAFCSDLYKDCIKSGGIITFNNTCVPVGNLTSVEMDMYNITVDGNSTDLSSYVDPLKGLRVRPTEEFYK